MWEGEEEEECEDSPVLVENDAVEEVTEEFGSCLVENNAVEWGEEEFDSCLVENDALEEVKEEYDSCLVENDAVEGGEEEFDSCWLVVVNDEGEQEVLRPDSQWLHSNVLQEDKTQYEIAENGSEVIVNGNYTTNYLEENQVSPFSSEICRLKSVVSQCNVSKTAGNVAGPIKCFDCGEVFQNLGSVRKHIKRCKMIEENKKRKCQEDESAKISHKKKQNKLRSECDSKIELQSTNQSNVSTNIHSGSKIEDVAQICGFSKTYSCKKCSYSTVYNLNFREHIMETHNSNMDEESVKLKPKPKPTYTVLYKCDACGKLYKDTDKLNDHLENHTLPDPVEEIKEEILPEESMAETVPEESAQIDEDEDDLNAPFKCTICSTAYFTSNEYNEHLVSHESKNTVRLEVDPESPGCVCRRCGQFFFSYRVNGVRPPNLTCSICFRHKLKTSKEHNYCCEICGKLFSTSKELCKHKVFHRPPLFFKCKKCPRVIKHKIGLRTHMRRHSYPARFICQTCGKAYKTSADLKRHMFKHICTMPAKCKECGEIFTNYRKAGEHSKVHDSSSLVPVDKTERNSYTCEECDIHFVKYRCFLKHMANIHEITDVDQLT